MILPESLQWQKSQIPNNEPGSKNQKTKEIALFVSNWNFCGFEFVWDLGLGVWDLSE